MVAATAVDAQVRLYDNLFSDPDPDSGDKDFLETTIPKYKRLYPGGPECRLKGA